MLKFTSESSHVGAASRVATGHWHSSQAWLAGEAYLHAHLKCVTSQRVLTEGHIGVVVSKAATDGCRTSLAAPRIGAQSMLNMA